MHKMETNGNENDITIDDTLYRDVSSTINQSIAYYISIISLHNSLIPHAAGNELLLTVLRASASAAERLKADARLVHARLCASATDVTTPSPPPSPSSSSCAIPEESRPSTPDDDTPSTIYRYMTQVGVLLQSIDDAIMSCSFDLLTAELISTTTKAAFTSCLNRIIAGVDAIVAFDREVITLLSDIAATAKCADYTIDADTIESKKMQLMYAYLAYASEQLLTTRRNNADLSLLAWSDTIDTKVLHTDSLMTAIDCIHLKHAHTRTAVDTCDKTKSISGLFAYITARFDKATSNVINEIGRHIINTGTYHTTSRTRTTRQRLFGSQTFDVFAKLAASAVESDIAMVRARRPHFATMRFYMHEWMRQYRSSDNSITGEDQIDDSEETVRFKRARLYVNSMYLYYTTLFDADNNVRLDMAEGGSFDADNFQRADSWMETATETQKKYAAMIIRMLRIMNYMTREACGVLSLFSSDADANQAFFNMVDYQLEPKTIQLAQSADYESEDEGADDN